MFDIRSLAVFFGAFIVSMFTGPMLGAMIGLVGVIAAVAAPKVLNVISATPYAQYLTFTFFAVLFALTGSTVLAVLAFVAMGLEPAGVGLIIVDFALFFGFYIGLISYVFPRMIQPKL